MNLPAILSISGLRIVLCIGKLYNFAYVVIAIKYTNLSMFFLESRVLLFFNVGILYTSIPLAWVREG
jgi:hypothetical protein